MLQQTRGYPSCVSLNISATGRSRVSILAKIGQNFNCTKDSILQLHLAGGSFGSKRSPVTRIELQCSVHRHTNQSVVFPKLVDPRARRILAFTTKIRALCPTRVPRCPLILRATRTRERKQKKERKKEEKEEKKWGKK